MSQWKCLINAQSHFLVVSEDVLDTFQEIQGTFQRIQTLARRQKDHLKRIHKGNDAASGNFIYHFQFLI